MREFHHHPDQIVYLRDGTATYADTLAGFAADLAVLALPAYGGVAAGLRERRYRPDQLHAVYSDDSQFGAELPWTDGDAYLDALPLLLTVQATRQESADGPGPLA